MFDITNTYYNLFGDILTLTDSTLLKDFKNIFFPPLEYVENFYELFQHSPKLTPLYMDNNIRPFLTVFIPEGVDSLIYYDVLRKIKCLGDNTTYSLNLTDASFENLIGIIGGSNVRLAGTEFQFTENDFTFTPINFVSNLVFYNYDKYPYLSGNMSFSFSSDNSGNLEILSPSLQILDVSSFISGKNVMTFNDISGFFLPNFDVSTAVIFTDATMMFYPDEFSNNLFPIREVLNILHESVYDII